MREMKIKYKAKVEVLSDGTKTPRFINKSVGIDFVKRYHDAFALLVGLNPCARDLMEYFVNIMDDDNKVTTSDPSRKEFIAAVEKTSNGEVSYSDSNVKRSIQLLVDRDCLIRKSRGEYIVNPQIYFDPRKTQKDRLDSIKMILEFKANEDVINIERECK
jgi:hypothetical protein